LDRPPAEIYERTLVTTLKTTNRSPLRKGDGLLSVDHTKTEDVVEEANRHLVVNIIPEARVTQEGAVIAVVRVVETEAGVARTIAIRIEIIINLLLLIIVVFPDCFETEIQLINYF